MVNNLKKFIKVSSESLVENNRIIIKEKIFKSNVFNGEASYYTLEFPNWANVVPVTKNMDIILIKQYRVGIEDFCIEIPGGTGEIGENPEIVAERELLEETGYKCEELQFLNKVSANPALNNNFVFGYLGINAELVQEQNLDEHEDIEIIKVPIDKIPSMIKNGEIHHPYAVLSLIFTLNRLGVKHSL